MSRSDNVRTLAGADAMSRPKSTAHVLDEGAQGGPLDSASTGLVHLTPAERAARGKAARKELPRSVHAAWEPGPLRRDPVDLLEAQASTRLPELGAIRYGRMLV